MARSRFETKRHSPNTREQNKTVLICCQGTATEPQYFRRLASLRKWGNVQIDSEAKDPAKVLAHAETLNGRKNPNYDYVFIIVDLDNDSIEELKRVSASCQKKTKLSKNSKYHLVLSNPSFDVWLVWHLKPLTHQAPIADLQQLLQKEEMLVRKSKKGSLRSGTPKTISENFPFENLESAISNAIKVDLDVVGGHPSTSIPAMIELVDSLNQEASL